MHKPKDIRYKADGPLTASIGAVLLPLFVEVKRPSSESALKETKRLVEQLSMEAARTGIVGGTLTVGDFATIHHSQTTRLTIEQSSDKTVILQCEFFAVLTFDSSGDFWVRANIISQHLDFLQKFCLAPRDKETLVMANRAKFINDKGLVSGEHLTDAERPV